MGRFYLVVLWCASIGYSLVTRGILSPYPVLQITIILLAPNVQSILADFDQLYHATANLIGNAINYTPEDGNITVRTLKTSAEIVMEVSDTGIGINEEDLPHIFERFYRAQIAKGAPGGSGLGLAIVKRIVQLHQGKIEVASELGEGTTFRVKFPVASASSAARTG